MEAVIDIDRQALAAEVERYLAAVELYRAEGCEPTWQPEPVPLAERRRPDETHEAAPHASVH